MCILDVGCGLGGEMVRVRDLEARAFGIDIDDACLTRCRSRSLDVVRSRAEQLPFRNATFDGAVCQVVIPLTDEERTLAEIARLLRPGGILYLSCHGSGYYLERVLMGPSFSTRVYALRSLLNTWIFATAGRRLPGFLGDTAYQSQRRLERYFRRLDLHPLEEQPPERFLGRPVFFSFTLEKRPHGPVTS